MTSSTPNNHPSPNTIPWGLGLNMNFSLVGRQPTQPRAPIKLILFLVSNRKKKNRIERTNITRTWSWPCKYNFSYPEAQLKLGFSTDHRRPSCCTRWQKKDALLSGGSRFQKFLKHVVIPNVLEGTLFAHLAHRVWEPERPREILFSPATPPLCLTRTPMKNHWPHLL